MANSLLKMKMGLLLPFDFFKPVLGTRYKLCYSVCIFLKNSREYVVMISHFKKATFQIISPHCTSYIVWILIFCFKYLLSFCWTTYHQICLSLYKNLPFAVRLLVRTKKSRFDFWIMETQAPNRLKISENYPKPLLRFHS